MLVLFLSNHFETTFNGMSDLKVLCPCLDISKSDLFKKYFVNNFKAM